MATTAAKAPTSDEAVSGSWSGSAGSRYALVDDYPDTGAADSLTSPTAAGGCQITFGFSAFSIPANATNISVQVMYRDDEASSGTNNCGGRLKVGGTYYNASTHNPSTTATNRSDNWATNPKSGSAWTAADINGTSGNPLQAFGINSTDASPSFFITGTQIQVTFSAPPSMSTEAVTELHEEYVGITTEGLHGTIVNVYGDNVTERGFAIDGVSHADPGNVNPDSSGYLLLIGENGSWGTGAFTYWGIVNLLPHTTYYIRSFGQNAIGWGYGDEESFTTLDWPIRLSASSNIADDGAASTTFQLTAPSGKDSGDFTAGKISDDTNPVAGDMGSGGFTEFEWAVQATSVSQMDATYEFRITDAGMVLSAYTVTPEWTIGTSTARNLTTIITGSSTTPDVGVTTARSITATIPGSSATPNPAATTSRSIGSSMAASSSTPSIAAVLARALAAAIAGTSITPDSAATTARAILAAIAGSSNAPNAAATTTRALNAALPGVSSTPDIASVTTRAILSAVVGASTTPDICATIQTLISLVASLSGSSLTPDVAATMVRALATSIASGSATPDIASTTVRSIQTAMSGTSTTPDTTATVQGVIELLTSIAGASSTPDITALTVRALSATLPGASSTADITATLERNIQAAIAAGSAAPDITATMEMIIALTAAITGTSIAPDITATIARALTAVISGASSAPDIAATTARQLLAAIAGTAVTPDDLILILAGLGIILDPSITSITPRRVVKSLTPQRAFTSITPQRVVESITLQRGFTSITPRRTIVAI